MEKAAWPGGWAITNTRFGLLESINKSRRIFVKPPNCLWHAPCSTSKTMPMMELGLGSGRRRKRYMRIWRRIIGRRWSRRTLLHCRHPWRVHLHLVHLLHLLHRRSRSSLHTHHQVSMNIVILDKWRPTCQDGENSLLGMALGLTWHRHRQRWWQQICRCRCGRRHPHWHHWHLDWHLDWHLHCLHRPLVCA